MGIIDDLTGGPLPKRVSDRELKGTWSQSGVYGKIKVELKNDRKFAIAKSIIDGSRDEDHHGGRHFNGITEKEIPQIVEQMKMSGSFTGKQIANTEKHLRSAL